MGRGLVGPQRRAVDQVEEFQRQLAAGDNQRPADADPPVVDAGRPFGGQIDPLVNDTQIAALLSAEEIAQLRALVPRLKSICGELADYHIPYSLNHGDLHSGNIITARKTTQHRNIARFLR